MLHKDVENKEAKGTLWLGVIRQKKKMQKKLDQREAAKKE